jgi:hypothetical protein
MEIKTLLPCLYWRKPLEDSLIPDRHVEYYIFQVLDSLFSSARFGHTECFHRAVQ